jgi:hypothetical protein
MNNAVLFSHFALTSELHVLFLSRQRRAAELQKESTLHWSARLNASGHKRAGAYLGGERAGFRFINTD